MPSAGQERRDALQKAAAEKDWFFIARFVTDTSEKEEAGRLIDERVEHYKSAFVSRSDSDTITISPGGIGIIRRHKPRSHFPDGWVGAFCINQTRVPLPLEIHVASCDEDGYELGVTLDPEASPGATYTFPVVICARITDSKGRDVSPRTGEITSTGEFVAIPQNRQNSLAKCIEYTLTVQVADGPRFDADAALDIYLLRQRSLGRSSAAHERTIALLKSSPHDTAEYRRLQNEALAERQWAAMYDSLLWPIALHKDAAVSETGRKCLFLRSDAACAGKTHTISAFIRGGAEGAFDEERVATEERFAQLRDILAGLDGASKKEDPTRVPIAADRIVNNEKVFLGGDKDYLALIWDDLAEREGAYLRSVFLGEAADSVVRFLNRKGSPGARILLTYAASLQSGDR
jgi:hypothetical protein